MHNPELHALSRVNWQLFCTFTFAREKMPEAVRLSMFFSVLRKQACNVGVHFKKLLWCLRRELGEKTGRFHYHAVIAGFPDHVVCKTTCFATEALWKGFGGGHAKVTEYNSSLDGVDYILKTGELTESKASRWAGDYHELSKFGASCDVMLSVSAIAYIEQRLSDGRRGKGHELWRQRRVQHHAKRSKAISL